MRQVQQIMGMPITIDIVDCDDSKVFDEVFEVLRKIDEQFSTYKPGSEVSKFGAGKLKENELSTKLTEVIKCCRQAGKQTDGYFSAWAGEAFDPSGYVKGWAIAEVAQTIQGQGYSTYCVSAGGDILAASDSDKVWSIGIQDPLNPQKILNTLSISNGAVATSGNYERGAHIINPKTGIAAESFLSVSVSGPDIITADILATAIFASGRPNPNFLQNYPDYKILVVYKK
jgi:thiamine biosynthesis lipoprotein